MTDIYLAGEIPGLSGASDQLRHLHEAGHAIIVLGTVDPPADLAFTARLDELPEQPARGSWLVTTDPARCAERPAGLGTILVGPVMSDQSHPTMRCDVLARDIRSAVLEILSREVM